jgi:hypothetical protein
MRLAETLETADNNLFPELALGLGRTVTRAYNEATSPLHRMDIVSEWGAAIAKQSGCAFDDGAEVLDEEPGNDVFFVLEKVPSGLQ